MGNNLSKDGLMSHETTESHDSEVKAPQGAQEEEPKTYQVVGEVRLTKPTTGSRPERVNGHTGTETRARLLREAAVGNFGQWGQP